MIGLQAQAARAAGCTSTTGTFPDPRQGIFGGVLQLAVPGLLSFPAERALRAEAFQVKDLIYLKGHTWLSALHALPI